MELDVPRMVGRVHNRIKEGQARFEGLTPLFLCHPHRCGARHAAIVEKKTLSPEKKRSIRVASC
jgi:hypothetical protein